MGRAAHHCAVAEVVSNDDGGVQGLEVQHQDWVCVEAGLWLKNERHCFHCRLICYLQNQYRALVVWCRLSKKAQAAFAFVKTTPVSSVQTICSMLPHCQSYRSLGGLVQVLLTWSLPRHIPMAVMQQLPCQCTAPGRAGQLEHAGFRGSWCCSWCTLGLSSHFSKLMQRYEQEGDAATRENVWCRAARA